MTVRGRLDASQLSTTGFGHDWADRPALIAMEAPELHEGERRCFNHWLCRQSRRLRGDVARVEHARKLVISIGRKLLGGCEDSEVAGRHTSLIRSLEKGISEPLRDPAAGEQHVNAAARFAGLLGSDNWPSH
ncbi:hypothetical protein [Mesorhizobium sp. B1-1-9]|uniref:hypothetical protein n=1 Tax=Mesorhizobium sp. B1-1-9 TaxID=2589975 RepID=UPI0015E38343|nr:hypothetical protein [Mesorhizobium sp. B1-1-9]